MTMAHDATEPVSRSLPAWARLGAWKCSLLAASLFLSLLLVTSEAADKEPGKGEYWRSVERVRGRASIETKALNHKRDEHSHDTWDGTESVQIDFTVERVHRKEPEMPPGLTPEIIAYMRGQWAQEEAASDIVIWRAAPGSVKIGMVNFQTNDSFHFPLKKRFTTRAEVNGVNLYELALELKVESGVWQLTTPNKLRDKYRIVLTGIEHNLSTNESTSLDQSWEFDAVDGVVFNGTLAGKPGPVCGTDELEQGGSPGNLTHQSKRLGRIEFWPEFVDAHVEVTIDDYAKWRPEGSITKPTEPGNHLVARGTLVPKDGGSVESLPKINKFRFELLDTSSEPGVCLNWPLGAKDTDYDLRLAPAGTLLQGQLSKKDQTNEFSEYLVDEKRQPYAETQINSYDFGGKATLRVICELADGRELVGEMKGEGGGESLIILPKMNRPGWISDSWRKEKKVEALSENDDDEKVEGQKSNGDGFTLYEEYRGWVVNGKRLEGEPTKKDFFVLNFIGGDAEAGIELFEELSQLKVHSKLKRTEMSAKTRLMNGNHRDAPQNRAQHGVWVKTFASRSDLGDDGAATVMNKKGVAGRPGLVNGVGILARDSTESAFNKPFNLTAGDAIFAYDRAIAHELLHSVGVEHHGSGDYNLIVGYASTRNPLNKVGRPYYGTSPDKPVDLRTEAGEDVAQSKIRDYEELRKLTDLALLERYLTEGAGFIQRNGVGYGGYHTPQDYADFHIELLIVYCFMHLEGVVGVEQGEHSGAEDCLMRYYFAKFYESKKPPAMGSMMYYLIEPGMERIGMEICHDRKGTGVNAAGHKPQSRFGDAAGTAGNCFEQICPNDAIPPRKTK